jgi:hypothetical protein
MAKVERVAEFYVRLPKRVGSLANALTALADGGVNGRSYAAWEEKNRGVLLFVANDAGKAARALKRAKPKLRFKKSPALAVTTKNRRGAGKRMARALAEADININAAHASATGTGNYLTVLSTDNDRKAERILKQL